MANKKMQKTAKLFSLIVLIGILGAYILNNIGNNCERAVFSNASLLAGREMARLERAGKENRYFDTIKVYRAILEEYVLAQKSGDETYIEGKWKYIYYDMMFYIVKDHMIYYSLEDLSGDGHLELIIGNSWNSSPGVAPLVIYYYVEGDGFNGVDRGGCYIEIYGNGMIELERAGHTYYCQFQKDSGRLEWIDHLGVKEEWQAGEVVSTRYIRGEDDEEREISKEEYEELVEKYTSVPVELEWKLLEGF